MGGSLRTKEPRPGFGVRCRCGLIVGRTRRILEAPNAWIRIRYCSACPTRVTTRESVSSYRPVKKRSA